MITYPRLLLPVLMGFLSLHAFAEEAQAPEPISRSTVPYVIAVLDRITLVHDDESSEVLQVAQDGTIPIDGKNYTVKGMTPDQARALIKRHAGKVAEVKIDEFRSNRITVLGEVFHQIFTDTGDGPMRVLDAIASANGFTPLANTRRVKLVRENAGKVEVYELDLREVLKGRKSNQNLLVQPGDVITVPRNFL